jgi:hypothetical protein
MSHQRQNIWNSHLLEPPNRGELLDNDQIFLNEINARSVVVEK